MFLLSAENKFVNFLYFAGNKFLRLVCKKTTEIANRNLIKKTELSFFQN